MLVKGGKINCLSICYSQGQELTLFSKTCVVHCMWLAVRKEDTGSANSLLIKSASPSF